MLAPIADDVWLVGPAEQAVPVRAAKGLRYLRLLLARPHAALTPLELTAAVNGSPGATGQRDLGEVLDRRALAEYRRRLAELDRELDEARDHADQAATARLAAERGFLLDEIGAATGLSGRARHSGGDSERARVAVQKSITAAIQRIASVDEPTGRLLRDTVRTGGTCAYEPDPGRPVHWVLDDPDAGSDGLASRR
jgi:hypothetical protein